MKEGDFELENIGPSHSIFFSVRRSTQCISKAVLCNMAPVPGVLFHPENHTREVG